MPRIPPGGAVTQLSKQIYRPVAIPVNPGPKDKEQDTSSPNTLCLTSSTAVCCCCQLLRAGSESLGPSSGPKGLVLNDALDSLHRVWMLRKETLERETTFL